MHRIDIRHIHVVTHEKNPKEELPMASLFQRSDLRHSIVVGSITGAVMGIIFGLIAHRILDLEYGVFMVILPIIGIILGAWFSSMVGMMTPNSELKPFLTEIEKGGYLLMVDVPQHSVKTLDEIIKKLHPEASARGPEPTFPSFP